MGHEVDEETIRRMAVRGRERTWDTPIERRCAVDRRSGTAAERQKSQNTLAVKATISALAGQ